jgi:hypothetical protein
MFKYQISIPKVSCKSFIKLLLSAVSSKKTTKCKGVKTFKALKTSVFKALNVFTEGVFNSH